MCVLLGLFANVAQHFFVINRQTRQSWAQDELRNKSHGDVNRETALNINRSRLSRFVAMLQQKRLSSVAVVGIWGWFCHRGSIGHDDEQRNVMWGTDPRHPN